MTKKLLCAMLLCAALTLCLLTGTALAATREVNDAAQLSSAFDSANSGDTIKLTANIEDISNNFLYTSDAKNRTLDLNGHKITLADSYIYTCFIDHQGTGTLTVTDSRSGGSIELDTGNYRSIIEVNSPLDNPGDLIISGGTLKGSAPATLYMRNAQSDLTITGGTIMNDEAVPIFGKAKKVTMTGGSVIGKGRAINISADIEISGGTVAAEEDNGIAITGGSQGATLTLSGPCVIKGKGLAIANGITPIIGAGLTAKASVNYGGSPLVDYDATQLSTYKYIEILPIARIGDATISGITSMALTEQDVTLTLTGDTFVTSINPIGSAFDAASWFNALPAGISAMVTCTDTKTATITFSGTPTATSTEAMAITIPAASLTGGASITALANANAKWDIAAGVPPRITAQPNHITVTVGQTATFSILADGHPAPTYQWQVNTGSGWQNVTDGTGGTTDTYTTPATTAIMSGYKYRCIASNGVSSDATSSEVVLLHPLHVEIVQDPASITAGEQVELRTVVSGGKPPYSYLWSTLATSPNIIVYPTATTTYTVTVVDSQPMPAHSNITVSMARAPVDPPASGNAITGITAGQRFTQGDAAQFAAVGGGADIIDPVVNDYRWLPTAWEVSTRGDFASGFQQSFTTANMTPGTHMLKATFTRQQYNGTAWVDTGDTDEKSVSFIVAAAPTALHIDTQPSEQFAVVGQTATFTVAATGDGLTYQWYINRGDGWRALPGAVNASYTTSVVTLANNGFRYYCLVSDRYGNTQEAYPAALHVEQAPDLPHTGDDAAPMLWLALCALGCAGLALLTRRKRKA